MIRRFGLLLVLLLFGCGTQDPIPTGQVYRDLEAGFALQVPAGWQATRAYGDTDLLLQPAAQASTTRISVQWDRRKDGRTVNLDQYGEFRLQRLSHFAKQRKLLDQRRVAMNASLPESIRLDYQYEIGPGHAVRTRSWLLVSERGQYTVSLTAPPSEFEAMAGTWTRFERAFTLLP